MAADLFPADTFLGHMHMRSNAPETALAFYTGVLGFMPHIASAAMNFFDCGTARRRHMVAFNTWGGRNLPKAPRDAAGLDGFTIELSSAGFGRNREPVIASRRYDRPRQWRVSMLGPRRRSV